MPQSSNEFPKGIPSKWNLYQEKEFLSLSKIRNIWESEVIPKFQEEIQKKLKISLSSDQAKILILEKDLLSVILEKY